MIYLLVDWTVDLLVHRASMENETVVQHWYDQNKNNYLLCQGVRGEPMEQFANHVTPPQEGTNVAYSKQANANVIFNW